MRPFRNFASIFIIVYAFILPGCKTEPCTSPQDVYIQRKDVFLPYTVGQLIHFKRNNTDTVIYKCIAAEQFFVEEPITEDGACPLRYESYKYVLKSSTDQFYLYYIRDKTKFSRNISTNDYTFYRLMYQNLTFDQQFYYSGGDVVTINQVPYNTVSFIGTDTNSFFAIKGVTGVLKIKNAAINLEYLQ